MKKGWQSGGWLNDLPSGDGTKLIKSIRSTTGRVENGRKGGIFIGVLSISFFILDDYFPATYLPPLFAIQQWF